MQGLYKLVDPRFNLTFLIDDCIAPSLPKFFALCFRHSTTSAAIYYININTPAMKVSTFSKHIQRGFDF
jgi:hypothetical protein